jgi:hypothetical protein
MVAIQKYNALLSSIGLFATTPTQQAALVDQLSVFAQSLVLEQPNNGCASGSIHSSLDGERAMCYLQWSNADAYHHFMRQQGYVLPALDSNLYEVAVSEPDDADLSIAVGRLMHLGEFRLNKAQDQARLVELEATIPAVALQHPYLLCVNFHRSLDGTRTMNYGFWQTLDRFERLLTDETFTPLREYWRGLAENEFHVYQVASVYENNLKGGTLKQ